MIEELVKKGEEELEEIFKKIDHVAYINSEKVINAFWRAKVSESHFHGSTGYGYGDIGRDTLEDIYADIFKAESALVRTQFISGTHAISTAFFALLRPGDTLLSITGKPYDTLDEIIGIKENSSSLKAFGIKYKEIDLINNEFDLKKISEVLKTEKIKVITIQRSIGYEVRKSISSKKLEEAIKEIRKVDKDVIIMVDNCYCEFVDTCEPIELGADLCVGSLIKNLGGGIASNGGYIVGKKDLVNLCSERLNVAGEGAKVGPSMHANKSFYQGLYLAPKVVANALKVASLAAYILENLGYQVSPKWNEERADIVELITFNDQEKLIKFVQGIQSASAIDSNVAPIPSTMPGYSDNIIMASGSFTQGSSIELSCDGPIRSPYVAYLQGSLTYEYGKIALIKAIQNIID